MATKPLTFEDQSNKALAGPGTAAPLPALVDAAGNIINASGFVGSSTIGGPVLETAAVLSPPYGGCWLSPDQIVGTEMHTAWISQEYGPQSMRMPFAKDIIQYITTEKLKSTWRGTRDTIVNPASLNAQVLVAVPEPMVLIPAFKTHIFVAPDTTQRVVLRDGCFFRDQDLSTTVTSQIKDLPGQAGITTRYTLHWYVFNIGGDAFPNNQPLLAVILTR